MAPHVVVPVEPTEETLKAMSTAFMKTMEKLLQNKIERDPKYTFQDGSSYDGVAAAYKAMVELAKPASQEAVTIVPNNLILALAKPKIEKPLTCFEVCQSMINHPKDWTLTSYTLNHKSGVEMWIANGFFFYGFYQGRNFTFLEKIKFARTLSWWLKQR